jgi:tetratricopeptide (TPR) repeat protein
MQMTVQQAFELAVQHHRAGRLAEAEQLYRQILAAEPNQPDALFNLGYLARQVNRPAEAAALWKRVASLRPDGSDVQYQLAYALLDANEPFEAASIARRAIAAKPDFADAHAILARALSAARKHGEALVSIDRATELAPDSPEVRNHAGQVHQAAGRLAEAREQFERAIKLNPSVPYYHRNLAAVLDAMDDVDGAIAAANESMRLAGEDAQILVNLSTLYRRRRQYDACLATADRAVKLQPSLASAHGARSIALLSLGNYEEGFHEYEWRWRCESFTTRPRDFKRPLWDGSDPRGRTIFVHSEQGFGDTIQFVRYLPMLAQRGAAVILECHASLRPLLRRVEGVSKVVPTGMTPPDFDLHAPLLSMPKWFKTTLHNVPNQVPYITPEPDRVEAWKSRISGPGKRIGLVWSGNVKPDPHRTCPLDNFAPLAPLAASWVLTFYSLQVADAAREVSSAPFPMIDLSKDLTDFAETAAAMQNLDLILTIDTAAAHLAGALGRPTWTLLPWAPDWRWLLDRADSPWYPTMRLFRQRSKGDWSEPIAQIVSELAKT